MINNYLNPNITGIDIVLTVSMAIISMIALYFLTKDGIK